MGLGGDTGSRHREPTPPTWSETAAAVRGVARGLRRQSGRHPGGTRPRAAASRGPGSRPSLSASRRDRQDPRLPARTLPAQPPVSGPLSTTAIRFVLATEARTVGMSSGRSVLRSMTSAVMPSADNRSAAASASSTPFIAETIVTSVPRERVRATPGERARHPRPRRRRTGACARRTTPGCRRGSPLGAAPWRPPASPARRS